mmetsp:Transcript_27137/g.92665  ORF Transcript_27137/g.92665 Transcript_27137/m.92665 type:complete len:184 (+) Transcript_27137:69-620(+)
MAVTTRHAAVARTARRSVAARRGAAARCAPEEASSTPAPPAEGPAAVEAPATPAPAAPEGYVPAKLGFAEIMGFGGWAPEVINGRTAMLAFLAGLGAEIVQEDSFPEQFSAHPFSIALAAGLVTLATFMPSMQRTDDYRSNPTTIPNPPGPFTPEAEKLNGRAAMIGLVGMLAVEGAMGHALL